MVIKLNARKSMSWEKGLARQSKPQHYSTTRQEGLRKANLNISAMEEKPVITIMMYNSQIHEAVGANRQVCKISERR